MKYIFSTFLILCLHLHVIAQNLPSLPDRVSQNQTLTYQEGITFLEQLAANSPYLHLEAVGDTDAGLPLHTAIFSARQTKSPDSLTTNQFVCLINNAIHPGEPDGVDASLRLLYELCSNKKLRTDFENLVLVVIPFYNIGGALNRRHFTRPNQAGPHQMGFRGNARNYDLNRDFIKADTRNARTFFQIFQRWQPIALVDTHVSNGADYPYTLTLLHTASDKLSPPLADYFREVFQPKLSDHLLKKYNEPSIPYVNAWRHPPDSGFAQFLDLPRYSSGYAAMFDVLATVPELHMLKPYERRVNAMYHFLKGYLEILYQEASQIREKKSQSQSHSDTTFYFGWQLDSTKVEKIDFQGYQAVYQKSPVTGLPQRYYDREKPFQKKIPFYARYRPTRRVAMPQAFWIPQSDYQVLERLHLNGIQLDTLSRDTTLQVEVYYIKDFKTYTNPYEGHYLHYDTYIRTSTAEVRLRKGDVRVSLRQPKARYLMETLWPEAEDSFFNWNFFDAILQRKEGISDYAFDALAADLLARDPDLQQKLNEKRKIDKNFANNAYAQLLFIYHHSPYSEPEYLRYPIFGER
ncbi:MAG: M14 family zinc carboxypeptidase [Bernardetiaceae bacterium]